MPRELLVERVTDLARACCVSPTHLEDVLRHVRGMLQTAEDEGLAYDCVAVGRSTNSIEVRLTGEGGRADTLFFPA